MHIVNDYQGCGYRVRRIGICFSHTAGFQTTYRVLDLELKWREVRIMLVT